MSTATASERSSFFERLVGPALFIALVASLISFPGYELGVGNHVEQLPSILRLLDPDFCPHDFFVNARTGFGPRFYYNHFMAFLCRFLGVQGGFLTVTFLANAALLAVTYAAGRGFFPGSKWAGAVAVSLVASEVGYGVSGADFLRYPQLIPQTLALPPTLLGVLSTFQGRALRAAALFMLASLAHPQVGFLGGVLVLSASLWHGLAPGVRAPPPRVAGRAHESLRLVGAIAAITSTTWIVWLLPMEGRRIPDDLFVWLVAGFRHPHHYLVSNFDLASLVPLLLGFSCAGLVVRNRVAADVARKTIATLTLVGLFCVVGFVFIEIVPTRAGVNLQPFRMVFLVRWLAWIFVGGAAGHLIGLLRSHRQSRAAAGLVVFLLWVELSGLFRTGLLVVFACLGLLLLGAKVTSSAARAGRLVLATVVIVACLDVAANVWRSGSSWLDPLIRKGTARSELAGGDERIGTLGRLARLRTPPDAVFLTPPDWGRFRLTAFRAIVVDFKAFPFSDLDMVEWKARLDSCYGTSSAVGFAALEDMKRSYRVISAERVVAIAAQYGADYAVVHEGMLSGLPVVASAAGMCIVDLGPPTPVSPARGEPMAD